MFPQKRSTQNNSQMHRTILDQIQNRWNQAASTWDVKALAQIYTPDALFFGLLPKLYIGRVQIEEYFGSYQIVLESVTLDLVDQNTRPLGSGAFSAQGFGRILNRYRDGSVVPNTVRSSFVVVQTADRWEISLHHFSDLIPDRSIGQIEKR